jgi:4-amino-4-deoxy-L-arabinose transferase-like glycosyltransferase
MTFRDRARAIAWGVFILFFAYYWATSNRLPPGAGPDQAASNAAAAFIYHQSRLATIPRDESALSYTAYGSTRSLRPPLSYMLGAGIAKIWQPPLERLEITPAHLMAFGGYGPIYDAYLQPAFRKGSALLCAMALGIAFYALAMHFGSIGLGLAAATLMGMMPQYAFIASYTNDDSSAIFSATLLIAVLLAIFRTGMDTGRAVLFGLACGLVLISKPTAWLLAPTVLLFLVAFVRVPPRRLAWLAGAALLACVVAGAWWNAFNVYHYGPGDPFARSVQERIGALYRTIPDEALRGFAARGIGAADLLLHDADNFWPKTIRSTIGKLDWVRLDVGPLHYALYITVFVTGLAYAAGRLLGYPLFAARSRARPNALLGRRQLALEALFLFAVVFQFAMYVLRNVDTEVQLQGKYLLPVLLPMMFLFGAALHAGGRGLTSGIRTRGMAYFAVRPAAAGAAALALMSAIAIGLHIQALTRYVIPYYWPLTYEIGVSPFEPVHLDPGQIKVLHDIDQVEVDGGTFRVHSTGIDPAFKVDPIFCDFTANVLLRVVVEAQERGVFQIFLDRGYGFREQDSYSVKYQAGRNELLIAMDGRECRRVRIDPAVSPGWIEIRELGFARVVVRQPLEKSAP